MAVNPFRIAELITAHLQGSLLPEQREELNQWLESDANRQFLEDFSQEDNFRERLTQYAATDAEATWNKTLSGLAQIRQSGERPPNNVKLFKLKWLAAAAAVAAIFLVVYLFDPFNSHRPDNNKLTKVQIVNDVAPGTKGATLTLADGKVISLSGDKNGIVANTSGISYEDGSVVDPSLRQGTYKESRSAAILTASTANGRSYLFTLPDGTRVWLNAASSIKFPVAFTGMRREVQISGEAYLEVFKDKAHPFIVNTTDQQLQVLGTHFNVRNYREENVTTTTLLEGSVKITPRPVSKAPATPPANGSGQLAIVLKPDQQSVLKSGTLSVHPANTDKETAWIKNDFYFRGETLENVLHDIARWYDVEVTFSSAEIKAIPLIGQISRNKPLSAVLERIATAGHVRFRIEGKEVTVTPDSN